MIGHHILSKHLLRIRRILSCIIWGLTPYNAIEDATDAKEIFRQDVISDHIPRLRVSSFYYL